MPWRHRCPADAITARLALRATVADQGIGARSYPVGGSALVACFAAFALAASCAAAAESAHLTARLTPKHLGRGSSIALTIAIATSGGQPPPPLKQLDIRYPNNLGIALSGLGLETCAAQTLEALGPAGCPPDSIMGYGSAVGEIPFGPEVVREPAAITIARAENENGQVALLLDAQGISPVVANLVLPALLLPSRPPYGGDIRIAVPLVPSLPEAPDVSVVQLRATIGPAAGLTYYEHRGAQTVPYTPKGILLPSRCPRGGFRFAAAAAFVDGTTATARSRVRCSPGGGRRSVRRRRG